MDPVTLVGTWRNSDSIFRLKNQTTHLFVVKSYIQSHWRKLTPIFQSFLKFCLGIYLLKFSPIENHPYSLQVLDEVQPVDQTRNRQHIIRSQNIVRTGKGFDFNAMFFLLPDGQNVDSIDCSDIEILD